MKIGILGSGFVGQSFAKAVKASGHDIMMSSRTPDSDKMQSLKDELGIQVGTIHDTIAFGEVIAFALRWDAVENVISQGIWDGKIVIDMMNRVGSTSPKSAGEELAELLPTAHVVKALNSIGAEHYTDANFNGESASMLIAGNSADAKSTVTTLISDMGYDVIDAGDISASKYLEYLAEAWIHLAFRTPLGRDIAFKVVKK